jgi:hypothetical protein
MTYDPSLQNRAAFIRGKGISALDTLLLPIAQAAELSSGSTVADFNREIDRELKKIVSGSQKTIDNYRTEIVRSLFGLVVFKDDTVQFSQRGVRLLESSDQSAFFKEIVYNFQFPFPGCSASKWEEQSGMSLRPGPFVIQLLHLAESEDIYLLEEEIYFYVLNSKQVQMGQVSVNEVLKQIQKERGSVRSKGYPVPSIPNPAHSRQHLKEFINYLELSMLVSRVPMGNENLLRLRAVEKPSIEEFLEVDAQTAPFSGTDYGNHDELREAWDEFWTTIPPQVVSAFRMFSEESSENVGISVSVPVPPDLEIGRRGELYVLELERARVKSFDSKLVSKIKDRANERNIGFDIQSVRADLQDEDHSFDEMIYIEVKSTKRATKVVEIDDSFKMTRNEWIKAKEGRTSYFIYRVYFTSDEVQLFVINDPFGKDADNDGVRATPTEYSISLRDTDGKWVENESSP